MMPQQISQRRTKPGEEHFRIEDADKSGDERCCVGKENYYQIQRCEQQDDKCENPKCDCAFYGRPSKPMLVSRHEHALS